MEQEPTVTQNPTDGAPVGVTPSAESAAETPEALRESLPAKTHEVEGPQERLLRLQAEFENSKKRMAREKAEFLKFAHEGLILDFLPVLDNLERAMEAGRRGLGSTPV